MASDASVITLFDRIVAKQIPASIIYEDDLVCAFPLSQYMLSLDLINITLFSAWRSRISIHRLQFTSY